MIKDFPDLTPELLSLLRIVINLEPGQTFTRGDHQYTCSSSGKMIEWWVWGKRAKFSTKYEWKHVGNMSKEFIETILDENQ